MLALRPGEAVGPLRVEADTQCFKASHRSGDGMIPFYEAKEKIRSFLAAAQAGRGAKAVGCRVAAADSNTAVRSGAGGGFLPVSHS